MMVGFVFAWCVESIRSQREISTETVIRSSIIHISLCTRESCSANDDCR